MPKANMSTRKPSAELKDALKNVPNTFRTKLIKYFLEAKQNYRENRSEACGIAGAKLAETIVRFLQQRTTGSFTPFGTRITNFADECRKISNSAVTSATESERIIIPRAILLIYTLRNKRGIGHVGGDVDANAIDAATIVRTADWVVCELIRIHHGLSLEEAQDVVDSLSVRELPLIWEIAGKKRVLKEGLPKADETLLLLYSSIDSAVLVEDLASWVEYSNLAVFKSSVLKALHDARRIEYDKENEVVYLSPKGAKYVEEKLLS